jgi:uncharacterized protein (DUF1800 family)
MEGLHPHDVMVSSHSGGSLVVMNAMWDDVAHLYRRAGFGATPDELDRAASAGYEATVDELLGGLGAGPDPTGDRLSPPVPAPPTAGSFPTAGAAAARSRAAEVAALQHWWLDRMIVTSTPLREKLTLLWHGHFATGASKVRDARLMYLQNQLFRISGAGSFEALNQAVAKGGAMMAWLDTATDKVGHPNENFARELMELFTLGIGQYQEAEVQAAARAFTGWVYDRHTDRWALRPRQHDDGRKTFLGRAADLGGEDIIDIAVHRPASAAFVTARVWSHLAYPVAPDDPVVRDLVPVYATDLQIRDLVRAVFLHRAFRSPAARSGLVKQPIEYLVGAARALRLDAALDHADRLATPAPPTAGGAPAARPVPSLVTLATAMGQTPFDPPNVGGWPQNQYWLNTGTASARLRAARLLAGRADLSAVADVAPARRAGAVARQLGITAWGQTTAGALSHVAGDPLGLVTLALNAPEYVLN